MNCRDLTEVVHAYVDGEFGPEERREADDHLQGCAPCRSLVSFETRFLETVRAKARTRKPEAPLTLRASIQRSLEREASPGGSRWRTLGFAGAGLSAAAAVTIVIWNQVPARHQTSSLERAAVDFHRNGLPSDYVGSDAAAYNRWAATRLSFNPRLPRLSLTPIGARVVSVDPQEPALQVNYAEPVSYAEPSRSRSATLVVSYDPNSSLSGEPRRVRDRDVFVNHHRGYSVVSWRDQALVYTLASDMDESAALALLPAR